MLKLIICGLVYFAVASAQTCDCNAFAQCVVSAKQAKHAAKEQCFNNCKAQLDPTLSAAMDKCKPPKDTSKMQCMITNTCTTKTSTDGERQGKGKGGKGGKGKGDGKMRMFAQFLTDAQQQSLAAFKTCARACHEETRGDGGKDACRTQHPNCGKDRSKVEAAKTTCGVGERTDHSEKCKCFLTALNVQDTSVCDKMGRGGKRRNQRSAEDSEDDSDRVEDLF